MTSQSVLTNEIDYSTLLFSGYDDSFAHTQNVVVESTHSLFTGPSNVQNNGHREQGNGSGSGYRPKDESHAK